MVSLSKVNAIVKTFLRDEHMMECVHSIEEHYPGIQIVLVDDGYLTEVKSHFYRGMRDRGHIVEEISLAFDSGFGAKTNLAMALCPREYILCCNDDFHFKGGHDGVYEMLGILDARKEIGLACGTWCGIDYQGYLFRTPGRIKEKMFRRLPIDHDRYDMAGDVPYAVLDICAVYGIVRRRVFLDGVRADARYKIGGEHGDWFMDIADAGWKIAFTPCANIDQVTGKKEHPDYQKYRMRQDWKDMYAKKHAPLVYTYFDGREEKF